MASDWQHLSATPMITLSTAHPAKFPDAVQRASGIRPALPPHMADLFDKPERMTAVQNQPELADRFVEMGLMLQGNLQCFSDPPGSATRRTVERFLLEDRYFVLGTDLHNLSSLPMRLEGLRRTIDLVGRETVDRLTVHNPRQLFPHL